MTSLFDEDDDGLPPLKAGSSTTRPHGDGSTAATAAATPAYGASISIGRVKSCPKGSS